MKYRIKTTNGLYLRATLDGQVSAGPEPPGNNARYLWELEQQPMAQPAPPASELPPPDSYKHARGTYLYSGHSEEEGATEFWLAASRFIRWQPAKREAYLKTQHGNTHIVVAFNTGARPEMRERPFNCLETPENRTRALRAVAQANDAGFQVWGYLATQEFLKQTFDWDYERVVTHLKHTLNLIAHRVHVVTPFREIGDIWNSDHLAERNGLFRALRDVDSKVALACHERSLEGIPKSDFTGVSGPTVSALQVGFGTRTSVAAQFMQDNVERMKDVPHHSVIYFEGSIPPNVYSPHVHYRTLAEARDRAKRIMEFSGADGNMDAAY